MAQAWPEACCNSHCDRMCGPRIGVQVPFQAPARIKLNPHIVYPYPGLLENALPEHAFDRRFGPILCVHDKRYCAMLACQGGRGDKHGTRRLNATLYFRVATVGHQETQDRTQPPAMNARLPDQSGPQMRPVIAQIANEEAE